MAEPDPTPKPRRRYPRRKAATPAEPGLQDEIAMLRAIIRLLRELAYEERPLSEKLRIYDALGKQLARLGGLVKAERALDEGQDLTGTLNQALAEVYEELSQGGNHE